MVKPKKHLGQHFLKNEAIAQRIALSLSGDGYRQVLEIGPGMGVLTQFLLGQNFTVKVAEIDAESVAYLETHFKELHGNIIPADFLKLRLAEYFSAPFAIIGNYPYNISSQIVFKMLEHVALIPEMVGMFQKEVAERLVAEPGSKIYGILSVLSAVYYQREYLFTVEPQEFNPPPKVRSGVIRFKRKSTPELDCSYSNLKMVVKMAFNQRRKTLRNALKALNLPQEDWPEGLAGERAEQLSYHQFLALTKAFENATKSG
jgi:16S rRNA (adenine1518-N6/adenine1519-N6)-dimethyltransferase